MAPDLLATELAAIREREQKAVRGPWEVVRDEYDDEESPASFPAALRLPEPQRYQLADGSLNEVRPESYEYSDFAELPPGTVEWIAAARTDLPRLLAAVEAVLALAAVARPSASFPPADCTNACMSGDCNCSGNRRAAGWDIAPDDISMTIARELLGKESNHD